MITSFQNDLTCLEKRLLIFLSSYSSEKPVHKETVLNHLNISAMTFRNICLDLRCRGYTICSCLNGDYYIADNKDEYLKFRDNYTCYLRSIRQAVDAMDKCMVLRKDVVTMLNGEEVNVNEL